MISLRVAFYVLYVVLGAIILVRVVGYGIRMETLTGIVLGVLLMALGIYRLTQVLRIRATRR
jgi:hypothetical protein